jgi:hypothetical protein
VGGSKAFVEVLFLCREYGVAAVTDAVQSALRYEEVSVGLVRFQLWSEIEANEEGARVIDYPGPKVTQGQVSDYADLMTSEEVSRG